MFLSCPIRKAVLRSYIGRAPEAAFGSSRKTEARESIRKSRKEFYNAVAQTKNISAGIQTDSSTDAIGVDIALAVDWPYKHSMCSWLALVGTVSSLLRRLLSCAGCLLFTHCCSLSLKQQLPFKRQRYSTDRFSKRSANDASETLSAEHHAASSTRSSRRSPRSHLLTNDWVAFSFVARSSWVCPLCTRVSRSKARKRSYSEE